MKRIAKIAIPLGILLLVAGGLLFYLWPYTARAGEPFGEAPKLDTPEKQRGQIVYMRHCDECHPNGEGGLGFSLNDKPLPKFLLKFQTRQGLGAMPAFDEQLISDADLDAMAEYIVALRKGS